MILQVKKIGTTKMQNFELNKIWLKKNADEHE